MYDKKKVITIVGGGISGLTTAYILKQAGMRVQIVHNSDTLMDATSGNPSAMLDARPVNDNTPHAVFNKTAFEHAYKFYDSLPENVWARRGLLKFPHNEKEAERFHKMIHGKKTLGSFNPLEIKAVDHISANIILNSPAPMGGLFFKNGGAVYPHKIRDVLSKGITIIKGSAKSIDKNKDGFVIVTENKIIQTHIVILSTGYAINDLCPKAMPHTVTRGQVAFVKDLNNTPAIVSCMTGYVIPTENGYMLGSTAKRDDFDSAIRAEDFETIAIKTAPITNTPTLDDPIGRVGFRSNPANRMAWALPIQDNFYIVAGMGSRGFINAPLCGQIIKSMILGEKLPISESVIDSSLHEKYGI